MGKIIDFNEYVDKTKKISVERNQNQIDIRGHKGSIIVYLNVECKEIKDKCFLINLIRKITGKSVIDVEEISEEDCKLMFIKNLKMISFEENQNHYESVWEELKEELIKSSNFEYSVTIGEITDWKNNFTYIGSKVFSIRN